MKTEVDPTWDGMRSPSIQEVAAVERVGSAFDGTRPGGWDVILWRPTLRETRALVLKPMCTRCQATGLPFELSVTTMMSDPGLADAVAQRLGTHVCTTRRG